MMSISQIIMLYTLNLYSVVCQLSLNNKKKKKSYSVPSTVLEGCGWIERGEKDLSFTGQMEHRSKRAISKHCIFALFAVLNTAGNNQGPSMGEWLRKL